MRSKSVMRRHCFVADTPTLSASSVRTHRLRHEASWLATRWLSLSQTNSASHRRLPQKLRFRVIATLSIRLCVPARLRRVADASRYDNTTSHSCSSRRSNSAAKISATAPEKLAERSQTTRAQIGSLVVFFCGLLFKKMQYFHHCRISWQTVFQRHTTRHKNTRYVTFCEVCAFFCNARFRYVNFLP